ncbi:MAG: hypothetical protein CAPSK01_000345 [Candidatus Accumulibacter vicinus]|uniref:Uncharacterized protein n=1 Tax=Candidatus Accumulibacter vicinus TaxID=2954382 RepID=A0A084Y5F5_9PROT|nr:MAG: hypothetical protein CAPSK01_000345 [Candidatus Accumulibacter vicinus]
MVSGKPLVIPDVADRFNFRCAASKLLALALFSLEPRDLVTGECSSSFPPGAKGAD